MTLQDHRLNVGITLAALDRGLHVLCEKSISTSVAELSRVLDHIERKSNPATLMVAFMRRFDDSYREAYDKIQAGVIGRLIVFRANQCQYTDTDPLYYDHLRNCGGSFIDAVIHDIDLALMFLGEDSIPKSCSAHGINAVFTDLEKN
ncbi:hypothetical protein ASPVEDRAFT_30497 [Aspergillus versicolor CBS 583.65]|uniref:Uncharacterized protein n=1 Tax=Aspergillus versicolor CBS 583.65 TaxID=1036611 RepID=A0A1L9PR36_ASPVE|nr:uncharacterized protein ASPVEDRAFT_30497 [Aspergillus versicolor CBS 583.65]OJJ04018.1 hypothetical protein ASPVEDRAFT_30497 [Aspergillus versicolor CBS 583.65]